MAHVAHHADDVGGILLEFPLQPNASADRPAFGHEALDEGLVHEHDTPHAETIAGLERAPLEQRDPHRRQVSAVDDRDGDRAIARRRVIGAIGEAEAGAAVEA